MGDKCRFNHDLIISRIPVNIACNAKGCREGSQQRDEGTRDEARALWWRACELGHYANFEAQEGGLPKLDLHDHSEGAAETAVRSVARLTWRRA